MAIWPMLVTAPIYLVVALLQPDGLPAIAMSDMGIMLLSGVLVGIGMVCLPWAFRHAPITIVGPFHYTQLIWGAAIGVLFFDQAVDVWTLIGGAVIIACGLSVMFAAKR